MKREDLLIEIHTEELPPKSLLKLAQAFCQQMQERLQKAELSFSHIKFLATPRRLALIVNQLDAAQKDQSIERKGPALNVAFDANGNPSPACSGFARSCGVQPKDLMVIKTAQGEWVGIQQHLPGKSVAELIPAMVEQSLTALPIPRRMRWGASETQFVRPIHSVIMLYGEDLIDASVLGYQADRKTRGHRFHTVGEWLTINKPTDYEATLEAANVIVDFDKRREMVRTNAIACAQEKLNGKGEVIITDDLLDEVTGLVEWPVALCGQFDAAFLHVPKEALISSMQDHQRYFPIIDHNKNLLPNFIITSNIESENAERVITGNERVLRARLSDAAFFFAEDKKESLQARLTRLEGIVFQAKLGSLHDRVTRISQIAEFIAKQTNVNATHAARAGLLSKADLTTNMVGEFPELQGVMGRYYALHDGEEHDVAIALEEHYMPRFAGDSLPENLVGQVVAVADKLDLLVGAFAINQIPTGDKDPYGLRRAALGALRILIEKNIHLNLKDVLEFSLSTYTCKIENPETVAQVLNFLQERLRAWYQEQGITADVFAAVAALNIYNPLDMHERIQAVQAFKQLEAADALSIANKRVSNIISKYTESLDAKAINTTIFTDAAEKELAQQLEVKSKMITDLTHARKYSDVLMQLADLRKPVDDFFDTVMVMTDDKAQRENRILLLSKLRALFLQVADIALLQASQTPNTKD